MPLRMLRLAPDWTMSSAISTEAAESDPDLPPHSAEKRGAGAPGMSPWQFFVLAGMLAATAVVIVATGQSAASIVILSLTVVATSLVAIGAYRALSPLTRTEVADAPALVGGRTRAALEREKTLVLRSIKELEFDYAMKKIAKSDFDEMSTRLRARAMGLMRQIDAGGYKHVIEQELNTRINAAGVRATAVGRNEIGGGRDFSPADRERQRVEGSPATGEREQVEVTTADDKPATACVACGVINDPDALFCKRCGSRIAD
jgi:hypothetical protein